MRISDWSADVCSSDLIVQLEPVLEAADEAVAGERSDEPEKDRAADSRGARRRRYRHQPGYRAGRAAEQGGLARNQSFGGHPAEHPRRRRDKGVDHRDRRAPGRLAIGSGVEAEPAAPEKAGAGPRHHERMRALPLLEETAPPAPEKHTHT